MNKHYNNHYNIKQNNPQWKGGKERYPNCVDCKKKLTRLDAIRCKPCDLKFRQGINGRNYKGIKYLLKKLIFLVKAY